MKVESHIKGRIRLRFELISEKREIVSIIDKLDGVEEKKEGRSSILVVYKPGSQAEYFFKLIDRKEPKKEVKLQPEDIYHYTTPLIKSPITKALYSIFLLGFRKGLIIFGICSLFLSKYLKNKF